MARPKDHIFKDQTQALQERSNRAKKKVKVSLATQLCHDIERLFKDEEFADLKIRIKSRNILVHKFIIKTRSDAIYKRLLELAGIISEDDVEELIMPDWIEYNTMKEVMRQLYTSMPLDISVDEVDGKCEKVMISELLEQLSLRKSTTENDLVCTTHDGDVNTCNHGDTAHDADINACNHDYTTQDADVNTCNHGDTTHDADVNTCNHGETTHDVNVNACNHGDTTHDADVNACNHGDTTHDADVNACNHGDTTHDADVNACNHGDTTHDADVNAYNHGDTTHDVDVNACNHGDTTLDADVNACNHGDTTHDADVNACNHGDTTHDADVNACNHGETTCDANVNACNHGDTTHADVNTYNSDVSLKDKDLEVRDNNENISDVEVMNEVVALNGDLDFKSVVKTDCNSSKAEHRSDYCNDISDIGNYCNVPDERHHSSTELLSASESTGEKPEKSEPSLGDLIKLSYSISIPYETCSQLGEDLLRGFLQETNSDCAITVSGTHFKAHRCILCVRSSYFSAMLSGSWMESDAEEMILEGITPGVMEQILFFLYGGVIELNETCLLGELVMAADMYRIEGMKDVVNYTLTKQLCHFFHKPCSTCETGVLEALVSAVTFNLPELKDKCIRWINNNMTKVWRNKTFSSMPQDCIDMCCNILVSELTVDNVLEVMLDCQKLNRVIPHVRWSEPVLNAVTKVMDRAIEYTSQNFVRLLTIQKFANINKGLAYQVGLLEEIFDVVIKSIRISSACQVYLELNRLKPGTNIEDEDQSEQEITEHQKFILFLFDKCESFMKLHIQQITQTKGWDLLSKDLQTHLLKSANFLCIDNLSQGRKAKPKLTSMQKRTPSEVIKSLQDDKHFMKTRPKSPHSGKGGSFKNPALSKKSTTLNIQSQSISLSDQSRPTSHSARRLPKTRKDSGKLTEKSKMELQKKSSKNLKTGYSSPLNVLSAASSESVDRSGQSDDLSSVGSVDLMVTVSATASREGDSGNLQVEDNDLTSYIFQYEQYESDTEIPNLRSLENLVTNVELAETEHFYSELIPILDFNLNLPNN